MCLRKTEVDAYVFSTLAGYCTEGLGNLKAVAKDTVKENPIAALNEAFVYMAEHEVPIKDQIVFASPLFVNALRETKEVYKTLEQADYNKEVNFQIVNYQGRQIVEVSPERLRTNVVLGKGGYTWGAGSKAINFLMVAKSAVIHVVKYEKVKVIGDDLNLAGQGFDGYTIFARIYHDVFVPDNKRVALYCSVATDGDAAKAMTLLVETEDEKVTAFITLPGEKLAFVGTGTKSGTKVTGFVPARVGDAATAGTTFYAVNGDMDILAEATVE